MPVGYCCGFMAGYAVCQIKHRFRDDAMADDLDMSGLRLDGMPDVRSTTISNIDQSNVSDTSPTRILNTARSLCQTWVTSNE